MRYGKGREENNLVTHELIGGGRLDCRRDGIHSVHMHFIPWHGVFEYGRNQVDELEIYFSKCFCSILMKKEGF